MGPRLSVCIPSYNQAQYIRAALDSVLEQAYADFELLVIDDCSTDGTREIVAGYAARDQRVRMIANTVNRGMVCNWNACLEEARGEYVKFVFGDDLLVSSEALGRMVTALDADASVSLVASSRKLIDADGRQTGTSCAVSAGRSFRELPSSPDCLAGPAEPGG